MQGKIISIDGIDGSGKTGQLARLLQAFEFAGLSTRSVKLPWKEGASFALIDAVQSGKLGYQTREAIAAVYCLNYSEALASVKKDLESGSHIVLHRYVSSIGAHQSVGLVSREERVAFYKKVENLAYATFSLPKADLNIILDVGESLAHKNIRKVHTPRTEQSLSNLEKLRKAYSEMAELLPNTKLIKCSLNGTLLDEDDVHNQIWQMVRRLALKI